MSAIELSPNPLPSDAAPQEIPSRSTHALDDARLRELTQEIAYELYERRGGGEGRDFDDWLEAERIARERLLAEGS